MATATITAWTKLLSRVIWCVIVLIVAAAVGKWLLTDRAVLTPSVHTSKALPTPAINWAQVDADLVRTLQEAAFEAEEAATHKLDMWTDTLMQRVDTDFLDWYFSYWNQQILGLKAIWYWSFSQVLSDAPDTAERMTEDVQEQFTARVLRPEIAQLELERLATEVLQIYVTKVREHLAAVPRTYQISPPDWERYLNDIAVITSRTEGNRDVPLTLKTLTVSTAAGLGVLGHAVSPIFKQLGSKVSGKLVGTAAETMAVKTGAKVSAKLGGKCLGAIIGIGVIIWDVWDHQQTKKVERPRLRQAITDYFAEVKQNLLYEPESGIMSVLHTIEGNVIASLHKYSMKS